MSRLRENVDHVFDVFVEVASPVQGNNAFVLWKFPEDYSHEKLLKSIAEFAFPCDISTEAVQLFSFVLTDIDGRHTFGYCRHTPRSKTCLVLLSSLPWPEIFYKFLNHVADVMNNDSAESWEGLLRHAYEQAVPSPGNIWIVQSKVGKNKLECLCPDHTRLPRIPDNNNFTEYYNAVDELHMINIFASMLKERRIIMTSRKLRQLSACVQAANYLIYPMHWQHLFIPVLPDHLFTYLGAPMPYLIGVPTTTMERAMKQRDIDFSDIVILDLDNKSFRSPFNDIEQLPYEVMSVLKKNLRNSNHLMGDGVARSFLRALVVLIGGYREALQFRSGEDITFNDESFVTSRPPTLRPFLSSMLHMQIFQQFKQDRLDLLNSGEGFQDEFEEECNLYSGKEFNRFDYQYKEWVSSVKKGSGQLMKKFQRKATESPSQMLQACLTVRNRGKEAFKDFKSMLADSREDVRSGFNKAEGLPIRKLISQSVKTKSARSSTPIANTDEEGVEVFETTASAPVLEWSLTSQPNESNNGDSNDIVWRDKNRADSTIGRAAVSSRFYCDVGGTEAGQANQSLNKKDHLASLSLELLSDASNGSVPTSQTQPLFAKESNDPLLIDFGPKFTLNPAPGNDVQFDPLLEDIKPRQQFQSISKPPPVAPKPAHLLQHNVDLLATVFGGNGKTESSLGSPRNTWETFD